MITSTKTLTIQKFVEELRKLPESSFTPTEPVRSFLEQNPVDAGSLAPYLNFDRQHYTRNWIDRTSLYELMAICWEVGQASSVHNHRDQNCWMAVPIGRLQVENFHLVQQDIAGGTCRLEPLNTIEMNLSHPCAVDPAAFGAVGAIGAVGAARPPPGPLTPPPMPAPIAPPPPAPPRTAT